MAKKPLVWLTEQDVVDVVDLRQAMDALVDGLRQDGQGSAQNLQKALGTWGDGSSMHALGSCFSEAGYAGFKTWVNTKRGAAAIFVLFDANDGSMLAVLEAGALGQLRTSGISGVATRYLARPEADTMALIGTGRQAMMQVAAVAAARPLKALRVYSRTSESRAAFAAEARKTFDFEVVDSPSLEAATDGADIVTLVTRAEEPFFHGSLLAKGAHLNAVGAILRPRAEFFADVFERADKLVCDYLPNLRAASREFIEYCEQGPGRWDSVVSLSEIVARDEGRPAAADVTLFKAMGMGISDLSVAVVAYHRAIEKGLGRKIDAQQMVAPRI
ncbi:MAG: ornithine cyclodeaminase family protein [Burkholderiaceae bacterium]